MTKTSCWTDVLSLNPSHYPTLHCALNIYLVVTSNLYIKSYSRSCLFPPPHTSHLSQLPTPWSVAAAVSCDQIWSALHWQCSWKVESGVVVVVKGWLGLGDNSLSSITTESTFWLNIKTDNDTALSDQIIDISVKLTKNILIAQIPDNTKDYEIANIKF